MGGHVSKYHNILNFLKNFVGASSVEKNPNVHLKAIESLGYIQANKALILTMVSEKHYYCTQARLYYVLFQYYDIALWTGTINQILNNKVNKSFQINHIKYLNQTLHGFIIPKAMLNTSVSHFLLDFVQVIYQIEVAQNGINIQNEIVFKLIKICILSIIGHKNILKRIDTINMVSRCNLLIKFGKYCLTTNKYYDSNNKYILKLGIKYLKKGINLKNKYRNMYDDNIYNMDMTVFDDYWKLGRAYLCCNKPHKVKDIISKCLQILNRNRNHPRYPERENEIGFLQTTLEMYSQSNSIGYNHAINEKKEQWNENVLPSSRKIFGHKEYYKFYHYYLHQQNSKFWITMKNLALAQRCIVCCRKDKKLRICSRCRRLKYCSRRCQKINWRTHRSICV